MIEQIREKARELLESGELDVVIGYAEGSDPTRTTPIFCRKPEDTDKLVLDGRCVNTLPAYLNKRHEYPKKGWKKTGIIGKGCDIRAITQLIAENQLKRDEVYIFGAECEGVVAHPEKWDGSLHEGNCASKCSACDVKIPLDTDFYPGEKPEVDRSGPYMVSAPALATLVKMDDEDRFAFWRDDFDRCFKCYACREVCPHCSCNICITDRTMPSWVDQAAHTKGVFGWHLTRAMHLVGRCTGCGECTRACPVNIQVDLFNQKMKEVIQESFDYKSGYSMEVKPPLITYNTDDQETYIR
ncbi:MAG: 4Fe-4S binding protein [Candidatus Polarisedimenticolaceae bacterium]|nr:4Fe-4S binding protein [Candidatus Polarisedimenticolaceae bacterium]